MYLRRKWVKRPRAARRVRNKGELAMKPSVSLLCGLLTLLGTRCGGLSDVETDREGDGTESHNAPGRVDDDSEHDEVPLDAATEPEPNGVAEPEPNTAAEPEGSAGECVAAVDASACCLRFVAVTREELAAQPCWIELEGVDPSVVESKNRECSMPCPADCVGLERRPELGSTAARNADGTCELVRSCSEDTCSGDTCDAREGCGADFVCAAYGCDFEGICVPEVARPCDDNYDPVCGCDGIVYSNSCHAGVRAIDYAGECVTRP
jgi:hypothetical protein